MPFAHLLSGLRARLIVLVMVAVLPAFILLLASSLEQRQSMVERQREGALSNAKLLASYQGRTIESTQQLLEWIAQFPEVQAGDEQACNNRLDQLLVNSAGIRGLLIADPQGNVECVSPRNPDRPIRSVATVKAFTRAVAEQSFAIGSIATGTVSGRPNLTFGLPVINASGQLERVVTIGLNLDNLQDTLRSLQMPDGVVMAVLDEEGVIVSRAPDLDAAIGSRRFSEIVTSAASVNRAGATELMGVDGVERLYAYAPYLLNGKPALIALVGYPTAALYAQADAQLRRNLLVLALFAVLTMLAAWLAGDIMIVRRARSVISAASQLRRGDLTARAGAPYGAGELSTLARDFDAMAGQLEQRQFERDQAMRDLTTSKDRYQLLVSAVSSIVWTSDRNGQLKGPNPTWEDFTGQRWPAYARGGGFDVVHPDDRAGLMRIWAQAINTATPVGAEYRLWHAPSQQYRHVAMRGLPMVDAKGQIDEWTGIIADIHERKQAEHSRQLLLDVSDALNQARDETQALSGLAPLLAPASADWCAVAMVDEHDMLLRVTECHAGEQEMQDVQAAGDCRSVPLDKAMVAMECLRTGQVQLIEHITPEMLAQWHDDAMHARQLEALQQHGLRQLLFVPVMLQGRPAALITLGITKPDRRFDASIVQVMAEVARRIALTLENQRLYHDEREARLRAERNADYLARLQSVSAAMSSLSEPSVQHFIDATLDAMMQSFGASTGAISLVLPDSDEIEIASVRGYTEADVAGFRRLRISDRLTAGAFVAATGEPVWLRNSAEYLERFPHSPDVYQRGDDCACAVVPIKVHQRIAGIIALNFSYERDFSPEDRDVLMALSTQCGQAMERMRLFEETQQLNQQLETRVQSRTRQLEMTIAQLRKSREQLHELSGQLLAAVEDERRRIAQEVHDELGQALTVIKMDIGFTRRRLDGASPEVKRRLDDTVEQIDETIRVMRRIATDLRPGILDSLGLEAAVESLVQEFGSRAGIRCNLVKESNDQPIYDKDISIAAYRIVQEALTNIARHSQATETNITYLADEKRLHIEIHDNGVGIADAPELGAKSLGMRGMQERARHVHGEVTVQGAPGKGTTVTLEIALKSPAGDAPVETSA
jgi:PAS domain S-box-containing protein